MLIIDIFKNEYVPERRCKARHRCLPRYHLEIITTRLQIERESWDTKTRFPTFQR